MEGRVVARPGVRTPGGGSLLSIYISTEKEQKQRPNNVVKLREWQQQGIVRLGIGGYGDWVDLQAEGIPRWVVHNPGLWGFRGVQ